MSDESNYECAVEIRDAIHRLPEHLAEALDERAEVPIANAARRERFVAFIFAELLRQEGYVTAMRGRANDHGRRLAEMAWQLADQLDRADPLWTEPCIEPDEPEVNLEG